MRVVLAAYACEPDRGSEPGVGWNWAVQAAALGHDVHVITRANNRKPIEAKLAASPIPGLTFHWVDLPGPLRAIKKRTGYAGMLAYYYLWQIAVAIRARALHRKTPFDLAHHVTFVIDWMPSGLAALDIPFVWGPIGGSTHVTPKALRSTDSGAMAYEDVRRGIQLLMRTLDPLVALTRRRADVILVYTREGLEGIRGRARKRARDVVHIGVDEGELATTPTPRTDGELVLTTGGRLVHWKAFDLLVEGFAAWIATGGMGRLRITGDGPEADKLREQAVSLGVADRVELLGMLPTRDDVYAVVTDAHLYCLPTLRDGPPVAILEAMLAAKPILCLDLGATAEMVPPTAGWLVDPTSRETIVAGIRDALAEADADREALGRKGTAAREHALQRHHWDRVGESIASAWADARQVHAKRH